MNKTRLATLHNAARALSDAALIAFHKPEQDDIPLDAALIVLKQAVADYEKVTTQ